MGLAGPQNEVFGGIKTFSEEAAWNRILILCSTLDALKLAGIFAIPWEECATSSE